MTPATPSRYCAASDVLPAPDPPSSRTTGRTAPVDQLENGRRYELERDLTRHDHTAQNVPAATDGAERHGHGQGRRRRRVRRRAGRPSTGRAQVRSVVPKPRASIAVASFEPRRIAITSIANAIVAQRRRRSGVAESSRTSGECQRTPVVDEARQQAEAGQRTEHEPGGQLPHLGQPVGEVGGVDAGEEQDRRHAEGEHPQQHRAGQGQRVVGDVHEEPVEAYGAAGSSVQRHVQRRERCQRQHRPDATRDERRREPQRERGDEHDPDHRGAAHPVEGDQQRQRHDDGGRDPGHGVHTVEDRRRDLRSADHAPASRWIRCSPSRAR